MQLTWQWSKLGGRTPVVAVRGLDQDVSWRWHDEDVTSFGGVECHNPLSLWPNHRDFNPNHGRPRKLMDAI